MALIERGAQWDASGRRLSSGPGGTCVNVGCVPSPGHRRTVDFKAVRLLFKAFEWIFHGFLVDFSWCFNEFLMDFLQEEADVYGRGPP